MDTPKGVNMAIEETNRKRRYRATVIIFRRKHSKSFVRKVDAEAWERKMLTARDEGQVSRGRSLSQWL
jgi:hypothetical protein